jgi:hypothetical protein
MIVETELLKEKVFQLKIVKKKIQIKILGVPLSYKTKLNKLTII